jgi:hypothetical protein
MPHENLVTSKTTVCDAAQTSHRERDKACAYLVRGRDVFDAGDSIGVDVISPRFGMIANTSSDVPVYDPLPLHYGTVGVPVVTADVRNPRQSATAEVWRSATK